MTARRQPISALFTAALPVLASALAACGGAEDGGERMNVLLITLDTTRPDRLSCYGGQPGLTPEIDAIAAEGARFERAISTAGITPMAHSSILTGLNNYSHGMRVFFSEEVSHRLKDSVDTLPELLAAQGYQTAARVSSYPVSSAYNLNQGFGDFDSGVDLEALDLSRQQRHGTAWDTSGKTATQRRGDLTTDSALQWLDSNGEDGPWCMWLHMFDVHDFSLVPPADFAADFGIEYPSAAESRKMPANLEWRERIYDPELAFMDRQIARLRGWLKEHGQDQNTVIVITADHGQGLSDGLRRHGWMKHRLLYDWSVRVPLIIRVPGGASDAVVNAQVRTIDIAPTVLEVLEVPVRSRMEGASLLDLMEGQQEDQPRIAYADVLNAYDSHAPGPGKLPPNQYDNLFMACDGRWKFIWHERQPEHSQLFDLLKDPEELKNLYTTDHPEAIRLAAFLEERQVNRVEPPSAGGSGPDASALNSLGYGGEDGGADSEEAQRE
ncbi:MAG: sulfatase, partial [Planctomycetota bacterium]|nr:sulfatase [Planctomycetota bacterium]